MIFVDTAFVVAWTNEDDMLHAKAVELQNRFRDEKWLTTDCVLLEIGNSLALRQRQLAIATIENLLTDESTTLWAWAPIYSPVRLNFSKAGTIKPGVL